MKRNLLLFYLFMLIIAGAAAQPFADIAAGGCQTFASGYTDAKLPHAKNRTDDYFLNLFLPASLNDKNMLLLRLNMETINSTISPDTSYSYRLSAISLPLGIRHISKNKKWETILIGIPKIAADFRGRITEKDYQLGGIFLQQYTHSTNLKLKIGLYYNREAFGDFFMPLVGLDWRATSRIYFYGILPSNYWAEYRIIPHKLYTGLNFKSYTRSFRLSEKNRSDYVRYDEEEIKLFLHWFAYKNILLFAEAGYSLGKNPWQYTYNTRTTTDVNPVYTPVKNYALFNVGIAYRIRTDAESK